MTMRKGRPMLLALLVAGCASPPAFDAAPETYRARGAAIEGIAGERTAAEVDPAFFGTTAPVLGRLPAAEEYGGGEPVMVISHGFWTAELGSRPEVIGSTRSVNGTPRTIIGVMPPGVDVPAGVALWTPRAAGAR